MRIFTMFLLLSSIAHYSMAQNVRPETGYTYTWEELRAMDEFEYESRWDDMTLLKTTYWVTAAEFAQLFGFSNNIQVSEIGNSSDIKYFIKDGRKEYILLTLNLKVHGIIEAVQHEENGIRRDLATLGNTIYEEIPTGVKDLRAYHRKDRGWVYVFSENGMSYFLLDYKKTMDETLRYMGNINSPEPKFEIARKYLEYFIQKYDPKL
ncbi:MAG: hypothetical protein ACFCUU_19485 [Cyclobacteriaceae bacterium]